MATYDSAPLAYISIQQTHLRSLSDLATDIMPIARIPVVGVKQGSVWAQLPYLGVEHLEC
jgi:hypothetical protein